MKWKIFCQIIILIILVYCLLSSLSSEIINKVKSKENWWNSNTSKTKLTSNISKSNRYSFKNVKLKFYSKGGNANNFEYLIKFDGKTGDLWYQNVSKVTNEPYWEELSQSLEDSVRYDELCTRKSQATSK